MQEQEGDSEGSAVWSASSEGVTLLFSNELAMLPGPAEKPSMAAVVGFIAALLALLMVGGAGPAYRLGLVDLNGAFALMRWGAWMGLAALLVALGGAWITRLGTRRRGFALA